MSCHARTRCGHPRLLLPLVKTGRRGWPGRARPGRIGALPSIHAGNGVKERAADEAAPRARRLRRRAMSIGDECEGLIRSGVDQRRIVEFMALEPSSLSPERGVGEKARVAVAKLHLSLG